MEKQQILARTLAVIVVIASVIPLKITSAEQKVIGCCTTVHRDIVNDAIIGYELQRTNLPCVKAVIFKTERGAYCIDWKASWVREKIRQFRAQNKQTSTHMVNNMTPTPTSSSISNFTHVGGSTQKPSLRTTNRTNSINSSSSTLRDLRRRAADRPCLQRPSPGRLFGSGDQKLNRCCTEVSRAIVNDSIISYELQRPHPPCVKAVFIKTERGTYCIDWKAPWVREKICQFRAQNKILWSTI